MVNPATEPAEHDPVVRPPSPVGVGTVGVGTVLHGRYRLEELIGRGGTAEVYLGIDELLGRSVAVKLFDLRLTDLNTVVRQRNEMHVLARLTHSNLIAVYDAHIADAADVPTLPGAGRTYLVLELVRGQTLAQKLMRGPLPSGEVAWIGMTLAAVLQAVHAEQLVHRDVKPANILLSDSGQIKLGDFGLARILTAENRLTTGADVMGTAAYFSPEQARAGVVGPPADIYSLGLVLLEALTGHKEFPGDPVAAAVARLLRDPVIPADLPAPWPTLLPAMTTGDPLERPTAQQVHAALSVIAVPSDQGGPGSGTGETTAETTEAPTVAWSSPMTPFLARPPQTAYRPTRRHAIWALAGAAAAVTLAAAALLITSRSGVHQPTADPITGSTTSMIASTGPVSHLSPTSSVPARPGTASTSRSTASTAGRPQPAIAPGTTTAARSLTKSDTATVTRAHPVPVTAAAPPEPLITLTTVPTVLAARPTLTPSTSRATTSPPAAASTTSSKSPPGRPTSKGKPPKKTKPPQKPRK